MDATLKQIGSRFLSIRFGVDLLISSTTGLDTASQWNEEGMGNKKWLFPPISRSNGRPEKRLESRAYILWKGEGVDVNTS